MFQKATVTYVDGKVVGQWKDTWMLWCKCQCLRIEPANTTKELHAARSIHTAVLCNLSFRLDGMDLKTIIQDCSAASIGLPRNRVSYNNKPWVYLSFKSEEVKQAAMERKFNLKSKDLIWCFVDDVKNLCRRCSSPDHNAKTCDTFSSSRGRSPIPKYLQDNYERFKPAGYKRQIPRDTSNNNKSSRSRSRSNSRNSRNRKPSNGQNSSSDHASSSTSTPNSKGNNVSYAHAVNNSQQPNHLNSSNTLDDSAYAPKNNGYKGKGRALPDTPNTMPKEAFNQIVSVLVSLVKDAAAQLTELRLELNEIKLMNSSFNKRLSKLETNQFLDEFTTPTQLPPDNLTTNAPSNSDVPDQMDTSTSLISNIAPNNTD